MTKVKTNNVYLEYGSFIRKPASSEIRYTPLLKFILVVTRKKYKCAKKKKKKNDNECQQGTVFKVIVVY